MPFNGRLTTGDRFDWYQLEVGADEHLRIMLDDANDFGANSLYVRYGQPPSRAEYHYRETGAWATDQQIDIADTVPGLYYVMVYANSVPDSPADYAISAATPGFAVQEVAPTLVGNTGIVTFAIRGSHIPSDPTAVLVAPSGARFVAGSVYQQAPGVIYPSFDLTGAEVGWYDVRLEAPNGTSAEMIDVVELQDTQGPLGDPKSWLPRTRITVPHSVRSGLQFDVLVEYWNPYAVDIPVPLLQISGSDGTHLSYNNRTASAGSLHLLGLPESGPPTVLPPGSSGTVELKSQAGPDVLNFFVDIVPPDEVAMDWGEYKEAMRPDYIDVAEWDTVWPVLISQIGDTWGDYYSAMVRDAVVLSEEMGDRIDAVDLLALEIRRARAATGTSISGVGLATDPTVNSANRRITAHNSSTGEEFYTTSLNDGSFIFDRVSPGSYTFTFYGSIVVSGNSAEVIEEQSLEGVQLELAPGSEILGQARDLVTRQALAGMRIVAIGKDSSQIAASPMTRASISSKGCLRERTPYSPNRRVRREWSYRASSYTATVTFWSMT